MNLLMSFKYVKTTFDVDNIVIYKLTLYINMLSSSKACLQSALFGKPAAIQIALLCSLKMSFTCAPKQEQSLLCKANVCTSQVEHREI